MIATSLAQRCREDNCAEDIAGNVSCLLFLTSTNCRNAADLAPSGWWGNAFLQAVYTDLGAVKSFGLALGVVIYVADS